MIRIILNTTQIDLLASNFHLVEGHGIIQNMDYPIQETKMPEYYVSIYVQGQPAGIRIGAYTRGSALNIARKLFPKATITGSATLIR
jgi:hypothetical protein